MLPIQADADETTTGEEGWRRAVRKRKTMVKRAIEGKRNLDRSMVASVSLLGFWGWDSVVPLV